MKKVTLGIIAITMLIASCKKDSTNNSTSGNHGDISSGNYTDKVTFDGQTYQMASGETEGWVSDTVGILATGSTSGGQSMSLEIIGMGQSGSYTISTDTVNSGNAILILTLPSSAQQLLTPLSGGSTHITWGAVGATMTATFNNVQCARTNLSTYVTDTIPVSGTIDAYRQR